jgi:RyR domain
VGTYKPRTIDTSQVQLSTDLQELIELLAENNHDHWARKRIDEGWRYGPKRNDSKKEHPDLVPYAELTDSEKSYDRKTVIEVLKAIIAIGYKITRV